MVHIESVVVVDLITDSLEADYSMQLGFAVAVVSSVVVDSSVDVPLAALPLAVLP